MAVKLTFCTNTQQFLGGKLEKFSILKLINYSSISGGPKKVVVWPQLRVGGGVLDFVVHTTKYDHYFFFNVAPYHTYLSLASHSYIYHNKSVLVGIIYPTKTKGNRPTGRVKKYFWNLKWTNSLEAILSIFPQMKIYLPNNLDLIYSFFCLCPLFGVLNFLKSFFNSSWCC